MTTDEVFYVLIAPSICGVRHRIGIRPDGSFVCSLGDDPRIVQAALVGLACSSDPVVVELAVKALAKVENARH